MSKIWLQVTGSHSRGQPEYQLFHDGRFFIGGRHSMGNEEKLEALKAQYQKDRIGPNWLSLPHTSMLVRPMPKHAPYPEYAWYYHNKIHPDACARDFEQILRNDRTASPTFFCAYPTSNLPGIIEVVRRLWPKAKIVYYKGRFWDTEVSGMGGIERVFSPLVEEGFYSDKKTEDAIIEAADIVYLSPALNTSGDPSLDSPEAIASLVAYRESYLKANKKVTLRSMKNSVYYIIKEA